MIDTNLSVHDILYSSFDAILSIQVIHGLAIHATIVVRYVQNVMRHLKICAP